VSAIRCVLDTCATVEEGVNKLEGAHFLETANFILADRGCQMAVVEASPECVRVRRPDDGNSFLVCTNHFMHHDLVMRPLEHCREVDSVERYTTVRKALDRQDGGVEPSFAQDILSDHSGHCKVCVHRGDFWDGGTIWSAIHRPMDLSVFRAEGHPCRSKYRLDERFRKATDTRKTRVL